jgi:glycosyltransferase involved in cell wall biosynthesis
LKVGYSATIWDGGGSGIGNYIAEQLRVLERCPGVESCILEFGGRVLTGGERPVASSTGGGIGRVVKPLKDIVWHRGGLRRAVRELGLEVVHVPTIRRLPGRLPCRTVVTVHDLAPVRMAGKYGFLRGFYHRHLVPKWLAGVDAIVTPSAATKADLIELYRVPPEKITVVPNGLDHDTFHPGDREESRERMRISYGLDGPYFVYISRLEHPAKNHVKLLEAFRRFLKETGAAHRLVLVGGDWQGSEIIREKAAPLVEAGRVVMTGFVPREEMPHFLRAAEAMIYPSLYEGFGLPVIEAMSCGTPVACSRSSALTEIAENKALLFDPESMEEISCIMGNLASDPRLREALGREGIAHAAGFSWERSVRETIAVWQGGK